MNVTTMTTEELREICRADIEDGLKMPWGALEPILAELTRRRKLEEGSAHKTAEEAYQEFLEHYYPGSDQDKVDPATGILLTPSFHGDLCAGNGEKPGTECLCEECDHWHVCYPDWYPGAMWDDDNEKFV